MTSIPKFVRFRHAREGSVRSAGRLPTDWVLENIDDLVVDEINLDADGPSMLLTIAMDDPPAEYFSVSLGGYLTIPKDDVAILRLETQFANVVNVSGAFAIIREWIGGGEFVGQSVRPIPMGGSTAITVAGRCPGAEERVLQPILAFRRAEPGAVRLAVRVARVAFASLYEHRDWLATPTS